MSFRAIFTALARPRLAAIVVLAVAASGCIYLPAAVQHEQTSPDTRPWWCDSTGSDGGHGAAIHYPGQEKGLLSWEDCKTLSAHLDLALDYAMQYPTLGDAESAGFHRMVNYVAGMGTHHAMLGDFDPTDPSFDPHDPIFPGTAMDGEFNPMRPEFLQYDGNGSDAKLVGMSWYVRTEDGNPPPGFVGDNDWWHVHNRLCFATSVWRVIGEDLTDSQCESRGGVNLWLDKYWMVHAWIVPGWEHQPDVFVGHHPCLLSSGPAAPDNACWDIAGGS